MQTLWAFLLVGAPLLGAALWFWSGKRWATWGSVATVGVSFISLIVLATQNALPLRVHLFEWFQLSPSHTVSFSLLFDALSVSLGLVVTGVGTLIHLYATSYMEKDESFGRFFSYLNLFVFSMLLLVFSDSLVGLFLGWEGVGLCSYLLISFWFSDKANAEAGKKAFIANRVGDFGFLIALFALFKVFGSLSVPDILAALEAGNLSMDQMWWTKLACFGLILGATGKSAQIPLYVWLPDAMAGPTPVSALIHAATMVTAGIYMICRLQPLFLANMETLYVVSYIGAFTAFFAATIAVFQNDIKKVLAYSTISQLGYMFLAVGLVAPVTGFFHLITHAFFKALLFLGAGSVIHGLHHEQDMRKMGALRTQMPITFWTMTIGVLAIAGIPPLSGFVSKDAILHVVSMSNQPTLIVLAFASAFLTAFYMGRLWVMTFFGTFRGDHPAHESPWKMTSVLVVLAVLSVVGGLLNWPHLWGGNDFLLNAFSPIVLELIRGEHTLSHSLILAAVSTAIGASGLALAYAKYRHFKGDDFRSDWFSLFKAKYYVDEFYEHIVVRNLKQIGWVLWRGVDGLLIDGALNGLGRGALRLSERMRGLQKGFTQDYALWIWVGFVILVASTWWLQP